MTSMSTARGICFVNARLSGGELSTLRIVGTRIAALGGDPRRGDSVVDLRGDKVFPGLINAHDHLQLNSLPSFDPAKHYRHVREWIAEVDARRLCDPEFKAGVAVARERRLLIGGIKNLLCGVTTVAHHDPLFPVLSARTYPIHVVQHYGWAHSLYVDGETSVAGSYRRTPADRPWIIHAAEGVDAEARNEFERLEVLGCLGSNTVLVHGTALDAAQRSRLHQAGAGLIWCPSSNLRLFGRTAQVEDLLPHGCVALGTDSRLSGARDLLEELRIAGETAGLDERALARLVTCDSARLLRLPDRGALRAGMRADILVLPAATRLGEATRAQVRLVLIDGRVRHGDPEPARSAEPAGRFAHIVVDGEPKLLDHSIAALLPRPGADAGPGAGAGSGEPGLDLTDLEWRAA